MSLSHVGRVVLRSETLPGKQGYVFQWRRQFFNHCSFPGLEGSGVVLHCHASNDLCGTDQMMYTQDRKKKKKQSKKSREKETHTHTHTHTHTYGLDSGKRLPCRGGNMYPQVLGFFFHQQCAGLKDFQTLEQRRSLDIQLQRLGHKSAMVSGLFCLSLGSVTVGEYSYQKPILERGNKRLPDISQ